jgi:DNA-directed RNA polymerase subunit RPC12/RpoP
MASNLLPEDKWIYIANKREDMDNGMWVYICSDNNKGENTVSKNFPINNTNITESAIHAESGIGLANPCYPAGVPPAIQSTNSTDDVQILDPEHNITMENPPETPQLQVVPVQETVNNKTPIHPMVKEVMTSMLNIIEENELKEIQKKISKPCGINIPDKYQPAILIESPEQDPSVEKKKKKKQHLNPEYDPANPAITHVCGECQKPFKSRGALRRHIQSLHSNENYECEECGKNLLRKDSIRRHYNTHHKGTSIPDHLVINSTDNSKPPKLVKFNLKSKTTEPAPQSQFSALTSTVTNDNTDLIKKLIDTLQSYKQ